MHMPVNLELCVQAAGSLCLEVRSVTRTLRVCTKNSARYLRCLEQDSTDEIHKRGNNVQVSTYVYTQKRITFSFRFKLRYAQSLHMQAAGSLVLRSYYARSPSGSGESSPQAIIKQQYTNRIYV